MAASLLSPANSVMSAPATKAFGPAPVMMADLMEGLPITSSMALSKSLNTSLLSAFNLSGLLMVMIQI